MSTLSEERIRLDAAIKALLEGLYLETGGGTIINAPISNVRIHIINYVKAKLDEIIPESEGLFYNLSSNPNVTNPYDLLINAHLEESTKDVKLSAPLQVLSSKAASATTGVHTGQEKTGYVVLPVDYLRLSSFKMADWEREVTIPITPQDPRYKRQSISFLRGGLVKPVAALNWKNIGTTVGEVTTYDMRRVLEYYSVDTSHTVEKLFYVAETVAEDFIAVNPDLLDALAWTCAGKIMQIIGQMDASKLAMERVKLSYIGL
jgi:hypothetical protein